jgi:hypothetical protein
MSVTTRPRASIISVFGLLAALVACSEATSPPGNASVSGAGSGTTAGAPTGASGEAHAANGGVTSSNAGGTSGAGSGATPGGGSGGEAPFEEGTGELARSSDDFVDIIGVNGHLNYDDTVYTNLFESAIVPRVTELGIRNWRDALSPHDVVVERQRRLAEVGVRFTLIVHDLDVAVTLAETKKALPYMQAIEGPNELDHGFRNGLPAYPDASTRTYEGVGFPGVVAAFQNDLYAAIKGDPATQQLSVVMAGFSFPDNTLDVGLVEGCDCGNTHSYPDGGLPTFRLDDWYIPRMQVNSGPDKPLCATETGYHNTPAPNGSHWIPPVSERAAAKYQLRLLFEYFNRNFQKVFFYEFADLAFSTEAADLNFGLVKSDGTPKMQFNALRNLIQILGDAGPTFRSSRLDYDISPSVPELQHTLLQKRDGSFYLALWLNRLSFDRDAKQDLEFEHEATLTLKTPVTGVKQYRPLESADATQLGQVQSVALRIPDHPLIVRVQR